MNEPTEVSGGGETPLNVEGQVVEVAALAYRVMMPHVVQESFKAGSLRRGFNRLHPAELYADIMQVIVYFDSLSSLLTGGTALEVFGPLGVAAGIGVANRGWSKFRDLRGETVTSSEES